MNDKQKSTLTASIKIWRKKLRVENPDAISTSPRACLCCIEYFVLCEGCPIAEYTGQPDCKYPEYQLAVLALQKYREEPTNKVKKRVWEIACERQIDFMQRIYNEGNSNAV